MKLTLRAVWLILTETVRYPRHVSVITIRSGRPFVSERFKP